MVNLRKIISILLVLISLIFLAVPWMNAETIVEKELTSAIENLDTYVEYLDSYQSVLESEGIDINLSKLQKNIQKITKSIDDLQVSPVELFKITRVYIRNQSKIKSLVSSLGYPIGDKSDIVNILSLLNKFAIVSWIYSVIFVIVVVLGITVLIKRIKGKTNKFQFLYLLFDAILLIFFILIVSIGNSLYQDSALSEYLAFSLHLKFMAIIAVICSVPVRLNVESTGNVDVSKFKNTVSNLVSKYVEKSDSRDVAASNKTVFPAVNSFHFGTENKQSGWTCPQCNNQNKDEYEYCSRCGTPKPQKPKCKHCGREIEENFIFCVYCGERVERTVDINDSVVGKTKFCKYCGEVIPFTSTFCPSCGEKLK